MLEDTFLRTDIPSKDIRTPRDEAKGLRTLALRYVVNGLRLLKPQDRAGLLDLLDGNVTAMNTGGLDAVRKSLRDALDKFLAELRVEGTAEALKAMLHTVIDGMTPDDVKEAVMPPLLVLREEETEKEISGPYEEISA